MNSQASCVVARRAAHAGAAVFTAVLLMGSAGCGGHWMLEDVLPDTLLANMDRECSGRCARSKRRRSRPTIRKREHPKTNGQSRRTESRTHGTGEGHVV